MDSVVHLIKISKSKVNLDLICRVITKTKDTIIKGTKTRCMPFSLVKIRSSVLAVTLSQSANLI